MKISRTGGNTTDNSREKYLEIALLIFVWLSLLGGLLYILNDDLRNLVRPYPCLLNSFTGLLCPVCGGTRAIGELLRGNLILALRYNALVLIMLPLALYGLGLLTRNVLDKTRSLADIYIPSFWLWMLLFLAGGFAIARNLPQLSYLWYPWH